ncbi:MAG: TlpA family protein disulfide reductase [Flavobacteriales bacterium]
MLNIILNQIKQVVIQTGWGICFILFLMMSSCGEQKMPNTNSIVIKTDSEAGFHYLIDYVSCSKIEKSKGVKINVSSKDTVLNLSKDIEYAVLTVFNASKTLQITCPLFIDSTTISVDFNNLSKIKNLKEIEVDYLAGHESQYFFDTYWTGLKNTLNNQANAKEDLKPPAQKNDSTMMAKTTNLFWLVLSQDTTVLDRLRGSISADCDAYQQFFIKRFEKTETKKLNYKAFTFELIKNVKPIDSSGSISDFLDLPEFKVYFWASWCSPCIREFKEQDKAFFTNDKHVFISIDKNEKSSKYSIDKFGMKHTYISDSKWLKKFGYNSIPLHFHIDNKSATIKKE